MTTTVLAHTSLTDVNDLPPLAPAAIAARRSHDWQLDYGDTRHRYFTCECGERLTVGTRLGLRDW